MRIIRYFLWALLSLIVLTVVAIAIVVNFVFTPSKLSPVVEKAVNENLNAKLSLSSVELTFFSTFPNFSVVVRDGVLVNMTPDTLVSFEKLDVVVNPIALVKDKRVEIRRIELVKPIIHARIDKNGVANWDIMKPSVEVVEESSPDSIGQRPASISLSDIRIKNGEIIFDDRQKDIYTQLKEVTMSLDGNFTKKISDTQFEFSFKEGVFWQDNKLLAKRISFSTVAGLRLNTVTKNIKIDTASVEINSVKFNVGGDIDSSRLDLHLSLQIPALDSVLSLASFIDQSVKVTTTGNVRLNANLKGAYRGGSIPVLNAELMIDDASLHYQGFENGIDKLTVNVKTHIDLKGNSTLTIDKFYLFGTSTSINFSGEVTSLLKNPRLKYKTNSTINLTALAATLPIKNGVEIGGRIRLNSSGQVSAEQLKRADYAHITANGEIKFNDVVFNVPQKIESGFDVMNLNLSNGKDSLLVVEGELANVSINVGRFAVSLDSLSVIAAGTDSKGDSFIGGELVYKNIKGSLFSDSLLFSSGSSRVAFRLNEQMKLLFSTDTLNLSALDNTFDMAHANVDVELSRKHIKGKVSFAEVAIAVPKFPLPMSMPATILMIDNQTLTLEKAAFKVGDSDMMVSGVVSDLFSASRGEKPLRVKMDVSSSNMNLTQIVHTFNQMMPDSSALETVSDTTQLNLFKIPQTIDFELYTHFKHLEFGKLNIEKVEGMMTLKNGVARLENLSLNALGARLATTVVYDSNNFKAGIMLASKSIDVHSVIELVPSLDTLMPMLNSFEGKLNFKLIADTRFYDGFTIHPDEIQATIGLQGEDLVLLDGKTFTEISKLLMFKNKERNVVDSIGVQMSIHDGAVEIFPFLIQIDRYRAAIGGEHFLTNKFDYHISILKSPVPFKFGVNITGSLDDMKVRIGKTKFKSLNQPNSVKQVNPKYIELGKEITDRIRKL